MPRLATALLVASLALAGCQFDFMGRLINGTGQTITVRAKGHVDTIAPGGSVDIDLTRLTDQGTGTATVEIAVANCTLTYRLIDRNNLPAGYPWPESGSHMLALQIAPDLLLYALPADAETALPTSALRKLQTGDFPLHPASRDCS